MQYVQYSSKFLNLNLRSEFQLFQTNLRELQSNINNTIEAVQRVTANPKTDTKLGKVGF